jgi:hypothetical protein
MGESRTLDWYARRARLRAAVLGGQEQEAWAGRPAVSASVTAGVLTEVRADAVVIEGDRGPEYLAVDSQTVTWLGVRASVSVLREGDPVIIRHASKGASQLGHRLAVRIWARIGRVAGTIVDVRGGELLVDTRDGMRQRVLIASASARQIQVRFPRLSPGYLVDVIGTRHRDYLLAVSPATAQPPYLAGHFPRRPPVGGPIAMPVSGSAVWHEPHGEPTGLLGLGYPAIDPGDGSRPADDAGCVRLPYLSLGSAVRIRNECAGRTAVLPVTSDGVVARQFCDRCMNCGTSPKGRVADLTMTAFVELGGNLEDGCFNATLTT